MAVVAASPPARMLAAVLRVVSWTMTFSIAMRGGDYLELGIAGELDAATVRDLAPSLRKLAARRPSLVAVNLTRLRMIDSNGLGALLRFYKAVEVGGGAIVFCGLSGQPLAVFRLLRLERLIGDLDADLRPI